MLDLAALMRLALLPVFLTLPGATLLLALPASRDPDAQAVGPVEAVWRAVMASVVLTGTVGLVLAELASFSLARLAALMVGGSLALLGWAAWRDRRPTPREARTQPSALAPQPSALSPQHSVLTTQHVIPLALFLLALALFARPHETVLGGEDAGVYVAIGAHIADGGGLVLREPLVAALSPEEQALFLQPIPETPGTPLRFPGFYATDPARGVSVPQFFPFYPVWLAIFYAAGGVWAALFSVPLWGALGVVSVYFAGRWAFGIWPAALGAALLAVLATQVWFSRFTTSEALTQALIWTGVAAFAAYVASDHPPRLGWLAGLTLGAVLLTRIDTPFFLALPIGLILWLIWRRSVVQRPSSAFHFFLPISLLTVLALAYAATFAAPYVASTALVLPTLRPLLLAVAGGGILVVLTVLAFRLARRAAPGQPAASSRRYSPPSAFRLPRAAPRALLALAIVALGLWAYFVRPLLGQPLSWSTWYTGTVVAYPHLSLVQLGWYLSPAGVLLAIAGAALAAYRAPARRVWPILAVGLFFAVLYLANPLNNPKHIYVMRRYAPVVFPAFTLFAGYAVAWIGRRTAFDKPPTTGQGCLAAALAMLLLALAVLVGVGPPTRVVLAGRQFAGAVGQVASLAGRFEPDAILVFQDKLAGGMGGVLGTPLQFLHHYTALSLQDGADAATLARVIQRWQDQGRPVYVLLGDEATWPEAPGVPLTPLSRVTLDLSALEESFDHAPTRWLPYRPSVAVYRVGGADASRRIDVGAVDQAALARGFYAAEGDGGQDFRWTKGDAVVRLPYGGGAVTLRLRLAAPGDAPVPVDVFLDDSPLGRLNVAPGFHEYSLPLPAAVAPARVSPGRVAHIRLVSPTFVPGQGDTRTLGILVDWVGWQ